MVAKPHAPMSVYWRPCLPGVDRQYAEFGATSTRERLAASGLLDQKKVDIRIQPDSLAGGVQLVAGTILVPQDGREICRHIEDQVLSLDSGRKMFHDAWLRWIACVGDDQFFACHCKALSETARNRFS